MRRMLLTVEYDGTNYAGWQRQLNGLAVQQVLEEALSRACGAPVAITGASRTDAGVHARGQALHFDTESSIPPEKYPFVLTTMLPPDIRVQTGREVPPGFHARFMTCGKQYTYRMVNARQGSALRRNTHLHVPLPLDLPAMARAAQTLLGTHDFAAFQASGGTAKTTVRTIYGAEVFEENGKIVFEVTGNGFLYNMVRAITGTVLYAAEGKFLPEDIPAILDSGDRRLAGPTVPPGGLYLTRLWYEDERLNNG